jgi:hypothetical protein
MSENVCLTQNADYLLCILYSAYSERCKNGESSRDAKFFGSNTDIQKYYVPEWPTHDIDEAAEELKNAGMLDCLFVSTSLCKCRILPDGIIYMENRSKNKLGRLVQQIATFLSIILG